jgi:DNA-binding GntR family transcriptional regulator
MEANRHINMDALREYSTANVQADLEANQRLHHTISIASGNFEAETIEARHWRILPAISMTSGYPRERLTIVIDDHRLMEQLIRDLDPEGAATLAAHCLRWAVAKTSGRSFHCGVADDRLQG